MILQFKFVFFFFFFFNVNFSNGGLGSVKVLLLPKGKKLQFVECFRSFPKEINKKEEILNFSWRTIKLLSSASRRTPCRAPCRIPSWVECAENNVVWSKLNKLSENLSFDTKFVLVFEIGPSKVVAVVVCLFVCLFFLFFF